MIYKVKNQGKHRMITYNIDNNGCWNCSSHQTDINGYPKYSVNNKDCFMHRILFVEYYNIINLPKKIQIRHTCDNPKCINLLHLLPGLHKNNMEDMVIRGRSARGSNHGQSKLIESQVLEIRMLIPKHTLRYLGEKYKVSHGVIRDIKSGKTWGWL